MTRCSCYSNLCGVTVAVTRVGVQDLQMLECGEDVRRERCKRVVVQVPKVIRTISTWDRTNAAGGGCR